jgi:hypothetical protein
VAIFLGWVSSQDYNQYAERQQVLISNPVIFGADLLGWGVDLRLGKPEEAIKVPIYQWTYLDGNNYIYPLEPKTTFRVPDEVFVRTVAEISATNRFFESSQDYVNNLLLTLGLSIDKAASNSSASAPTNSSNFSLSSFSGSVDVTYQTSQLSDNQHIAISNTLESGLWQLVVGPSLSPRLKVQQDINDTINLATGSNADPNAYAYFINLHGTHYIESVIVGGYLEMSSSIRKSSTVSNEEIAVNANAHFQNTFGLSSANANLALNITSTTSYFETESNNWMKSLGGDPELANFFSGSLKPNETFTLWQETLISNPAVIRYRLREISWLFDRTLRSTVSQAVAQYLLGNPTLN